MVGVAVGVLIGVLVGEGVFVLMIGVLVGGGLWLGGRVVVELGVGVLQGRQVTGVTEGQSEQLPLVSSVAAAGVGDGTVAPGPEAIAAGAVEAVAPPLGVPASAIAAEANRPATRTSARAVRRYLMELFLLGSGEHDRGAGSPTEVVEANPGTWSPNGDVR